jgi:photosystem II stability/assembly factor-like uncharacterized protein
MRQLLLFTSLIFLSFALSAQELPEHWLDGMAPRNIGPAGMSGRINSIDVVADQPDIIYVGTAAGGVWKSESGGTYWEPVFDDQPIQSIGAIAVDQNNPSIVWAGTGEGNPRNSHNSGAGIYKSLDAGRTWSLMGLEETKAIHRIIIHPNDPNVVYAAALGSAWGPNEERGVFRTTDGGKNWEKILYINDTTGCADLVMDPSNPNKLFAAMWQFYRQPWFFTSGGKGSGLYVSHDGGDTWVERTEADGLPKGDLGRIGLAIAAGKPKVVYTLVEAKQNALYRSDDGGFKFKKVADKNIGNRPFYYADIFVDPKNENRLYNLYSLVSRSDDGGKTFEVILPYNSIHPDHHAFYIHPDNPNFLIDGNDGGLAISRNGGETWQFIETLPLAQFYHINVDDDMPYNIYGGMQDNGSWVGPAFVWQNGGIRNSHWEEVMFGDGFDVIPDQRDNRYGFAMYQGGNLYHYDKLTGYSWYCQPLHPDGEELRFNWNAALEQDPHSDCTIYFGSQYVHQSNDCGETWEIISPDLTSNDTAKQKQAQSGGLTIDATRAENYTALTAIEVSPIDRDIVWAGSDDGCLHVTEDGGETWTRVDTKIKDFPAGAWIPFIHASPHNEKEVLVVVNDYRRNNWSPYLFKSTDLGKTWTRLVSDADVNGHCLSVAWDPQEKNLIFLGTDQGLYYSLNGGKAWQQWTNGMPSTPVRDMVIHPSTHDLVMGTFGRAAWIIDDISPLRLMAYSPNIANQDFYVFPSVNPGYQVHKKPASGVRFTGEAVFIGENKSANLAINCLVKELVDYEAEKEEESDESENEEQEKKVPEHLQGQIFVHILNGDGDTIRSFWTEADTGINRVYWDMKSKGVHWPSHESREENKPDPAGDWVIPGKYMAIVGYDKWADSTLIEVRYDPRMSILKDELEARAVMIDKIQSMADVTHDAFERLKEAEEKISAINESFELASDSAKKQVSEKGKVMQDSILTLKMVVMKEKHFDGYDHVTKYLEDKLWHYGSYTYTAAGKPTPTAEMGLELLREEVGAYVNRVNGFFDNQWIEYRELVESTEMPLFEDLEPLPWDK